MSEPTPPGSPAAVALGCTCPVADNGNGAGVSVGADTCYWYAWDCPLHCSDDETRPSEGREGGRCE